MSTYTGVTKFKNTVQFFWPTRYIWAEEMARWQP